MIIDAHTHFGSVLDFDMPQDMLIRSMDRHGIDCAVVSNIEGIEYDHNGCPLAKDVLHSQIQVCQASIDFARRYPGRIYPLLWVMPQTGGATAEFRKFIAANRDEIYGLKFHPYLNQTAFDSALSEPYIRIAAEFGLPIAIHTASSEESSPWKVALMAQKYPEVKFLLVHMGLYTDNKESIGLILKYPNLYGDTTLVQPENAMKLIQRGGIDKILFGTDAPVAGMDGYLDTAVQTYIYQWSDVLGIVNHNKLISQNAMRFFGIRMHLDKA
ncbi:MAG: amidohydrolase family protein [Saccharofermentanales bacterium]